MGDQPAQQRQDGLGLGRCYAIAIRVQLSDTGELDPAQRDRIIDIVVEETVQTTKHPN